LQRQVYRFCYSIGIGGVFPATGVLRGAERVSNQPESVVDPVCGEEIDPTEDAYSAKIHGVTYHFCCVNCQLDFEEAPEKYIGPYGRTME
jgi:YHS domain-containing protein